MTTIGEWLASLGLAEHTSKFVENHIDFGVLPDLTDQDLTDLGVVSIGHRRKLTRAIADSALVRRAPVPAPSESLRVAQHDAAERRQITVMFCDLVGSTALSAQLDPEDMREVVMSYQRTCAAVVRSFDGFVAKYMGDGVVIYFGYPRAQEDDPERAVRAAMEMVTAVGRLHTRAARPLQVRIGIATGMVVVGDLIGAGAAQEEAVVGETPNLAARLQVLAEPGGILVSSTTRRLIGGLFKLRDLGSFEIHGWLGAVEAWAVEGLQRVASRFAARSTTLTPFVGREAEMEDLLERKTLAFQGRGQTILITGEPGIGKSRVAAHLAERITGEAHFRAVYQCTAHHRHTPMYPFIAQLERVAGMVADDTAARKLDKLEALFKREPTDAAHLIPLMAELMAVPLEGRYAPLDLSPAQQRRQLFTSIFDQLGRLSGKQPLVILVEDAHWADPSSRELLDQVVDAITGQAVLLVVTARPEFEPAWAMRDNVGRAKLGRLDKAQAAAIIGHFGAAATMPTDIVKQIVAKTDGVPLFVEELTKMVLESGLLRLPGEGVRPTGLLPDLAIPTTLQDSLMARLDRLAPVKEIAQIGSAVGREFPYRLILSIASMDEATLQQGLERLEEAELLSRTGAGPDAIYTFKHALVQDAAYNSMLKTRRHVIHRMIAIALRDRFPVIAAGEPEVVAHHFTQADKPDSALEWWTKAGELALRRSAYHEARTHFEKAIVTAQSLPDEPARRQLRLRLQVDYGNVLIALLGHSSRETTAAFARTAEIATDVGNETVRFAGQYGVWVGSFGRGDVDEARDLADAFLKDAKEGAPEFAIGHLLVGSVRWSRGDYVGARDPLEYALAAYDGERDRSLAYRFGQDIGVSAMIFLALVLWPLGDTERALALADRAMEHAYSTGHIHTQAYAHFHAAVFEAMRNDPARTLPHARALVEISREHDLPLWYAGSTFLAGWAQWRAGDRIGGEAAMREARSLFRGTGAALIKPLFAALWAEVRGDADPIRGTDALGQLLVENNHRNMRWFDAEVHRQRAEMLLRHPLPDAVMCEAALSQAIDVAQAQKALAFEMRARLALAKFYETSGRTGAGHTALRRMIDGMAAPLDIPEHLEARNLMAASRE